MDKTPIPLILDLDTGVDDALALMLAIHSPEIQLLGVTTVSGNTSAYQAALNTLFLLDMFSKPVGMPVAAGGPASLAGRTERDPWDVHGRDGLGGVFERYAGDPDKYSRSIETASACDFLLDAIARMPDLTIVATGPLTNLAKAFQKEPHRFRRVRQILVMGGAVGVPGNVTPYAEFNAHFDPLAVDLVLRSGVPVVFYPLDVTLKAAYRFAAADLDQRMAACKSRLVQELTGQYIEFYRTHRGIDGLCMHDVHPVAGMLRPDLYRYKRGELVAATSGEEYGRLRWAQSGETGTQATVAIEVDPDGFIEFFLDRLKREPPVCTFRSDPYRTL